MLTPCEQRWPKQKAPRSREPWRWKSGWASSVAKRGAELDGWSSCCCLKFRPGLQDVIDQGRAALHEMTLLDNTRELVKGALARVWLASPCGCMGGGEVGGMHRAQPKKRLPPRSCRAHASSCKLFCHQMGSVFFLESRIYTKRELHHVRVGNLAGGRRRAEASRRHFAHILVFFSCVGARVGT